MVTLHDETYNIGTTWKEIEKTAKNKLIKFGDCYQPLVPLNRRKEIFVLTSKIQFPKPLCIAICFIALLFQALCYLIFWQEVPAQKFWWTFLVINGMSAKKKDPSAILPAIAVGLVLIIYMYIIKHFFFKFKENAQSQL